MLASDGEVDNTVKIINTCVLVLLLAISLLGNSLLIFTTAVATNRAQSGVSVYILSMAAFGLLECSLTMSLATGFSIEEMWVFGDFLMGFNCCFTQLQNIGVILTITIMSIDRYLIVCKSIGQHRAKIHRANYAVLYTWVHSFVISLPLLFHNESGLRIRAFLERSLCSLSEGATIAYTASVVVTSICAPTVITVLCFIAIYIKSAKRKKSLRSSNPVEYANYCVRESDISIQARYTNYVLLLFLMFLVFKLPYLIVDITTQSQPASKNDTNSEELQGGRFYHETALVWMMFCFSALFPLLTFAWFAEHKNRIRMYLCCGYRQAPQKKVKRKQNTSNTRKSKDVHVDGKVSTSYNWDTAREGGSDERQWCNRIQSACYNGIATYTRNPTSKDMNVPVLYATADGLHLMERNSIINNNKCSIAGKVTGKVAILQNENKVFAEEERGVAEMAADYARQNSQTESSLLTKGLLVKELASKPVSDRRIDVLESNGDLQLEGEYLRCGTSFSEDDTETELNTSANSMTLILPDFHTPSCPHSLPSSATGGKKQTSRPLGCSEVTVM